MSRTIGLYWLLLL